VELMKFGEVCGGVGLLIDWAGRLCWVHYVWQYVPNRNANREQEPVKFKLTDS
jgi:hypothetical protein